MEKDSFTLFDIAEEVLSAAAMLAYIGLQIYYQYLYYESRQVLSYELFFIPFLYAAMLLLQKYPEFLNGRESAPLKGKVRFYAKRLVRGCKFVLMLGILIPSIADVLGVYVNAAYSLFLMFGILAVIAYYMFRIYQYNKSQNK